MNRTQANGSRTKAGRRQEWRSPSAAKLEDAVRVILRHIGEDPDREGLERTPARVAKAYEFLTSGYAKDPKEAINGALFSEADYQEMILCKDLDFYSLCEHHLLPFMGKAHVAYLPNRKIVGLSKLARMVEIYARRLQVQERLTTQIAQTHHGGDRAARRRGGARGRASVHADARSREAELLRHDVGDAGRVPHQSRDAPRVHATAAQRQTLVGQS